MRAWRSGAGFLAALTLAACASASPTGFSPRSTGGGSVSLITEGWHTDIALPAEEATGPLARFRAVFPGARMLVFGYGKRTFMIAPAHTLGEWIIGPFPGPAAIQVSALSADAAAGYGAKRVVTLPLPPGGAPRLADFLWRSFAKNGSGEPRLIAEGNWPGSLFYDAASRYGLNHTCNTWSAEALAAGGLPLQTRGMVFSGQLTARAREIAADRPLQGEESRRP